jgi:CitMHS family citrate-Mg2+:H+ or citrate-Ca2+:H+ symporter
MLAVWGLLTILLLLILVIKKLVSPVVALILVPVVIAGLAGFSSQIPAFIGDGLRDIAPTGVMFIFAILFFGVLMDAGTFKPVINALLKLAGSSPPKVAIATAILAMIIHLDGSGAVTFLVVIPAMLPVYEALGMKKQTLACITALAAGTMNILPWGGPTIRASASLGIPVTELFNPILIPVLFGLLTVLIIAYLLGKQEEKRLIGYQTEMSVLSTEPNDPNGLLERPKLFFPNIILIVVAIGCLIAGLAAPHVIFMIAFSIALVLNYPKISDQKYIVDSHAKEALMMASILFAAGCFTGVLKGTGMIGAMAASVESIIPDPLGHQLPLLTGIVAMPASLLFDPDSFYFGILPLLVGIGENFQVEAIEIGRAAIMGQMTTGFAVSPLTGSTFLLIGLARIDLGEHQVKTIPFAFLVTMVILAVSIIMGLISI